MNPLNPSLVGRPAFLPNRDLVDWENAGPVVALGVDLENYDGEVYLKPKHVVQIARVLNMVTPEEVAIHLQVIEQLKAKIKELETSTGDEIVNGKLDDIIGYVSGIAMQCSCPAIIMGEEPEGLPEAEDKDESSESEDVFSGTPDAIAASLNRSLLRTDL